MVIVQMVIEGDMLLQAETLERSDLKLRDVMEKDPPVLLAGEPAGTAAELLDKRGCSAILVVEQGRIVGVVTRRAVAKAYMAWLKSNL